MSDLLKPVQRATVERAREIVKLTAYAPVPLYETNVRWAARELLAIIDTVAPKPSDEQAGTQ